MDVSGAQNYWITSTGYNTLKGVPGDASNPPVLDDDAILKALQRSQKAVDDFNKMLPLLLLEERQRLEVLVEENPQLVLPLYKPAETRDARFMSAMTRIPVYTAGKGVGRGYGGGRAAPTPKK